MKTIFSSMFTLTLFLWAGSAFTQDSTSVNQNKMNADPEIMAMMTKHMADCEQMHKMCAEIRSSSKSNQKTNSVHRGHKGYNLADKESVDSAKTVTHTNRYNPKYPFRK